MRLSEEEAKTYRGMVLKALEGYTQAGPLHIIEVSYGPRHNELSFRCSAGRRIRLTLSEESWS